MKLIQQAIYHLSAAIFCSILILLGISVFCRYVLNNSIVWSEELIRFGFIWMFFLSMGEVSRTGSHLALDLLPSCFRENFKRWYCIAIEGVNIIFFVILIYYSFGVASANLRQFSPALQIPYGYIYLAMPAGGVLMILFSADRIKRLVTGSAASCQPRPDDQA